MKEHIFTSVWSAQHPKAGQNIQHPYEIVNKWRTSICYLYCKIRNLISKSCWSNFTVTTLKIYQSQTLKNCKTFLSILGRVYNPCIRSKLFLIFKNIFTLTVKDVQKLYYLFLSIGGCWEFLFKMF